MLQTELVEHSAWSNDEINYRINMLNDMLKAAQQLDDFSRIGLQREIATWRELQKRREQSPKMTIVR